MKEIDRAIEDALALSLVPAKPNGQQVTKLNPTPNLTAAARAAVENGLVQHQAMIDEVDALTKQTNSLLAEIAGLKAQNEVYRNHLNETTSRLNTAMLVRDQCVADCAKYETLFLSIRGDLQRFLTPGATLVKAKDEEITGL